MWNWLQLNATSLLSSLRLSLVYLYLLPTFLSYSFPILNCPRCQHSPIHFSAQLGEISSPAWIQGFYLHKPIWACADWLLCITPTRQAMYVYRNTGARSRNDCCCGKAISITYSERVSVTCLPACNAHAPYCNLWTIWLYRIFVHYLINSAIFAK